MTFVGKLLVVVNVGLTLCIAIFAGGVFAVQTNWKEQHAKAKADLDTQRTSSEKTKSDLDKEVADLKKELSGVVAERETLKGQLTESQGALATEKKLHRNDSAQLGTVRQSRDLTRSDNEAKHDEILNLREALKNLHDRFDKLTTKVAALEDEKYGLEQKGKQLVKTHNQLAEEYLAARKALAESGVVDFRPEDYRDKDLRPTPSDGLVVGVLPGGRDKSTLVEISVGKDDGVSKGQSMFVFRLAEKSRYLGKIEIVYVTADKAVGTLVDNANNGSIQKGDNVSAKL